MGRVKLPVKTIEDLSTLAMDRCTPVMNGVLQLVEDEQQKMIVATNVAAMMFGLAARFLQYHYCEAHGEEIDFPKAVDAVVFHVAKLALETPAPPLSARKDASRAGQ